ncbi:exonuclease [Burkholderia pseudomallei]|nr:exonuclease [Burkholderia pseudomallei]CAJ4274801.1 exonuclease [Burkholderia pseudomallei]
MKVAIIDTETTGIAEQDEPISVGILLLEIERSSGKFVREIARYHGWREPHVPIHPKAYAVHGMIAADLVGKTLDLFAITSLINEADVLIAHNAEFDARMLSVVCDATSGKPWRCSLRQFPWPTCIGGKRLDSVCDFYGVVRRSCHDALADCEALLAVLLLHAGKTTRSRTFMALLLAKSPLGFDKLGQVARSQTPTYLSSNAYREPHHPKRPVWDVDPVGFEPTRRRRPRIGVFETIVWVIFLFFALVASVAMHS